MRLFLGRIFKNFPILKDFWIKYIEVSDSKYYKTHCQNYEIIPFGNYCLPRVITTVNRLKIPKKYGGKSFPFDLCFSNFSLNTKLLSTKFDDFFDDIEYDNEKKWWINRKYAIIFNHDGGLTLEEFKTRYKKRINNLYNSLYDKSKHIYFIIAKIFYEDSFYTEDIEVLINEINKYRKPETYDIILINQTKKDFIFEHKNVHIINLTKDKCFEKIHKTGDWVNPLKNMKTLDARFFNYKVNSKLSKIIKP